MASEIQRDRAQAQDLRDTQDAFRKQSKAVREDGARELKRVREETGEQVAKETNESAAVVNHLRQDAQERIDTTRRDVDQRLTYARTQQADRYHGVKLAGEQQIDELRRDLETKEADLARAHREVANRRGDLQRSESQETDRVRTHAGQQRGEVVKGAEAEIAEVRARTQSVKSKLRQESTADVRREAEHHRGEIQNLREQHREIYRRQGEYGDTQLKAQAESDQHRLNDERQQFVVKQDNLKTTARTALAQERDEAEQRFKALNDKNSATITQEREKGRSGMEETRGYYDKEVARIHHQGDAKVAEEKTGAVEKLKLERDEGRRELEGLRRDHGEQLTKENETSRARARANQQVYRRALGQQRQEYVEAENKSRAAFETSVREQKDRYTASLVKEKTEVLRDLGRYQDRRADPFYRLVQVNGRLEETDTHYVLTAEVPEHERANVRVSVRPNQILIQGHRSFEDKVERDGGTLSTESYQTFREDVPLEHPVRERFVRQSYANGVLTVKIPKA